MIAAYLGLAWVAVSLPVGVLVGRWLKKQDQKRFR